MANRYLLHKTKLDEFKKFLDKMEITHREGRGAHQIMQIKMDDCKWQCIWDRSRGDHYSVPEPLVKIVTIFTRDK